MHKFLIAGIITITLPFGVQGQNPTAINAPVGSNTSYNWAGYQATGGTFTAISGTWTIPSVSAATSTEADVMWIGIGGVSSRDLIQVGTQAIVNPGANNPGGVSATPTYEAWYEVLPQATQQVALTVSPGDSISASITQTASSSGNTPAQWSVSIRDNTTGQSYQTSLSYNSSLSSAEWIEEMPSDGSRFVPLDNFGSVSFSNGVATENGSSVTISSANAQMITMVNRAGQTLASSSSLGSDGESFTVTRTAASSSLGDVGVGGFVGRGGLGRGWRRTGVGVQGFIPTPTSSPTGFTRGGIPWARLSKFFGQFQNFRNGYLRKMGKD
jgi:hypothetical protein